MANRNDVDPATPGTSTDDNDDAGQGSSGFNQIRPQSDGGEPKIKYVKLKAFYGTSPGTPLIHFKGAPNNGSIIYVPSSFNNYNVEAVPPTFTMGKNAPKLTVLPERESVAVTRNIVPYKIKDVIFQNMLISCINVEPFSDEKLMVSLETLVQSVLYPYGFNPCLHILVKLKTKLYRGNSEQMELLLQKNLVKSLLPEDVPLIMYDDLGIDIVLLQELFITYYEDTYDGSDNNLYLFA